MGLFDNKKLKIVAATSIAIFSLAVCFTGVFAWFENRIVSNEKGNYFDISAMNDVTVSDPYKIYEYDFDKSQGVLTTDMELHGYDCFIESNNELNRKYLFIDVSFPNGIPEPTYLNIDITATLDNFYVPGETKVARYISNMIQFKYVENTDIDITKSPSQVYAACYAKFNAIEEYDTFVSDPVAGTKHNIVNNTAIPLPQAPQGYYTTLIIEYTYNQKLIDFFKNRSGIVYDVTYFKEHTDIVFEADINQITFSLKDVGSN